ncbi:hAT dimerisation domain-containing protein / transposase-related, partial [Striga hermonthica]
KLLEDKRPHLFWTPCAAHCVDLILEDIGKLPYIKDTLKKAMSVNAYVYVRPGVVNMLRHFTGEKELVRAGVTRFATAFLTLERMQVLKEKLRDMFRSRQWEESQWKKEAGGVKVTKIIFSIRFWNNVLRILKIFGPLVRVLRLVDGEKRPAMGYIYEAMDKAKEAIRDAFDVKEDKYKDAWEIIDKRWNCQLHKPLHAAAHYLNPQFLSSYTSLDLSDEIGDEFILCVERLVPDLKEQEKKMTWSCLRRKMMSKDNENEKFNFEEEEDEDEDEEDEE